MESDNCEPPKPRLKTGRLGKSLSSVFQRRMPEAPVKRMPPLGGGFCLSASSKATISFSKRLTGGVSPRAKVTKAKRVQRRAREERMRVRQHVSGGKLQPKG